jgi:hypothetical protein
MARFFDAKKHGDLQKQATTESDSFSQLKTQIYANVAPRFEKAAALHQSNQVLALTTAILLFKSGVGETVKEIPVRMLQIRMRQRNSGIPLGIQMSDFVH